MAVPPLLKKCAGFFFSRRKNIRVEAMVLPMSAYRIYELTADDHIAAPPTIVDCPDDTAAIEKARQRLDHRIIEVQLVDRCVIRMQPIAERRIHG
jgi:hypothetical protein